MRSAKTAEHQFINKHTKFSRIVTNHFPLTKTKLSDDTDILNTELNKIGDGETGVVELEIYLRCVIELILVSECTSILRADILCLDCRFASVTIHACRLSIYRVFAIISSYDEFRSFGLCLFFCSSTDCSTHSPRVAQLLIIKASSHWRCSTAR